MMRLLDKTRSLLKLNDLGMPTETHQQFSKMYRAPFGMVLCAGPTGSGTTTTLFATLSEIDEPYRKIMTEDRDVVLVGQIRDVETARIAVQSALSGHLVLSSLHATDSVSALHRLLDIGIEPFLISSSVIGVVGQRLVRRICPSCKAPYRPSDEERAFYEESGGPAKDTFYQGEGCNFCSGTGYRDRIGIFELLRITTEIKRLIIGWATQASCAGWPSSRACGPCDKRPSP